MCIRGGSWARLPKSVQSVQQAKQLGFVRGFAHYCSAIDALAQVPPPDLIAATRVRRPPHFFSDSNIEQLLHAALALPPVDGLRRWTFHCLFGLLSVSGLRIGEAIALTFEDVDLQESILTIRSTKFGKSRLVPMHASTVAVLADYMQRAHLELLKLTPMPVAAAVEKPAASTPVVADAAAKPVRKTARTPATKKPAATTTTTTSAGAGKTAAPPRAPRKAAAKAEVAPLALVAAAAAAPRAVRAPRARKTA